MLWLVCAGRSLCLGLWWSSLSSRESNAKTQLRLDHDWGGGVGRYHHDHPLRITRGDSRGRGDHPAWGSGGRPPLSRGSRMRGETPEQNEGIGRQIVRVTLRSNDPRRRWALMIPGEVTTPRAIHSSSRKSGVNAGVERRCRPSFITRKVVTEWPQGEVSAEDSSMTIARMIPGWGQLLWSLGEVPTTVTAEPWTQVCMVV